MLDDFELKRSNLFQLDLAHTNQVARYPGHLTFADDENQPL